MLIIPILKNTVLEIIGEVEDRARETAVRVAAGAIADIILSKILGHSFKIKASVVQIGPHKIDAEKFDENQIDKNPFFCGDANTAKLWENYLDAVRKQGSSSGAVLEVIAKGVPVGIGQPLYSKLDSEIASAMMSINAVKGVEIGGGFSLSEIPGKEAGDQMVMSDDGPEFLSNNAGGYIRRYLVRCTHYSPNRNKTNIINSSTS